MDTGRVATGDEQVLPQLQRLQTSSSKFAVRALQLAEEIESEGVTTLTATLLLKASLRLYQRHLADCRRNLLFTLFSSGYQSTFEIVDKFESANFSFDFVLPVDSHTSSIQQIMGTYHDLYADDVSVASVADTGFNTAADVPPPNCSALPVRTLDMGEITSHTLQHCADRINIQRIELSEAQCEEFLLGNSSITADVVDRFVAQHNKLVKLMYLYKTMVLPNASLDEQQHLQYLEVLLLKDLCNLFEGRTKADLWYRVTRQPIPVTAKFTEYHRQVPTQVIELTGLPHACVYLPVGAAAPAATVPVYEGEPPATIVKAQAVLDTYRFLTSVKCLFEYKFTAFSTGSTRVCHSLKRSAKFQVCAYAAAVRQTTKTSKPFQVMLSDGMSCQLMLHMEPERGRQNEFRCLGRSQTERMYILQTMLALFVDTRVLHAWLKQNEERLISEQRASAVAAQPSVSGRRHVHADTSSGDLGDASNSLSDISEAGEKGAWEVESEDDDGDSEGEFALDEDYDDLEVPSWITNNNPARYD